MSISLVLLAALGLALLLPLFGDEDDDGKNEISGTNNDDTVQGTEGNDLIRTFLGDDTIYGNGGNDEIRAGEDDDYVEGGDGLDFVRAGAGNDEVYGNNQDDRLFGDQGNDLIDGGAGSDVIRGGRGDDLIFGGAANLPGQTDTLSGEDDDDTIFGWGDGTVMNGGQNDAENSGTNDDTLVMVTGEGEMTNRTGDNTNIALANVSDDQDTFALVTDFDRTADTLILTADTTADVTETPDYTVNYEFQDATSERGAGMLVTVVWNNPPAGTAEGDIETASAFLEGVTQNIPALSGLADSGEITDDSIIDVDFYVTENASLTDPVATLGQMGISTPAIDAWPTT